MRLTFRLAAAAVVCVAIAVGGCSRLEPQSGTRVTFDLPGGKPVAREKLQELCRYLIVRAQGVLDVDNARVESASGGRLVLLAPGRKVSREQAESLLEGSGLEFYHLRRVATKKHPERPWKLRMPARAGSPYILTGPDAQRVDSHRDPDSLLRDVVGAPAEKPVLTGGDVRPNAESRETANGYAVMVRFTEAGARRFHEFTRDNPGEYLAVFFNGILLSAPVVKDPIEGGEAFITGFRAAVDAQMAVSRLNAGVLPAKLKVRSVEHFRARK